MAATFRNSSVTGSMSNIKSNVNGMGTIHGSKFDVSDASKDPNFLSQQQENQGIVLFNITKKEVRTPSDGYKTMQRKLRHHFKLAL
jgi:hypothetical protein